MYRRAKLAVNGRLQQVGIAPRRFLMDRFGNHSPAGRKKIYSHGRFRRSLAPAPVNKGTGDENEIASPFPNGMEAPYENDLDFDSSFDNSGRLARHARNSTDATLQGH
jgi:hypothetical protein